MDQEQIKSKIENAQTALGIELGSTRIKAVLVTNDFQTVASGDYVWENELNHHIWTYPMEKVWEGIRPVTPRWLLKFMKNMVWR